MKKLLLPILLIVGCAVNIGHEPNFILNIATKQSEKSCLEECEKYDFGEPVGQFDIHAHCVCMDDCTKKDWCFEQHGEEGEPPSK